MPLSKSERYMYTIAVIPENARISVGFHCGQSLGIHQQRLGETQDLTSVAF